METLAALRGGPRVALKKARVIGMVMVAIWPKPVTVVEAFTAAIVWPFAEKVPLTVPKTVALFVGSSRSRERERLRMTGTKSTDLHSMPMPSIKVPQFRRRPAARVPGGQA